MSVRDYIQYVLYFIEWYFFLGCFLNTRKKISKAVIVLFIMLISLFMTWVYSLFFNFLFLGSLISAILMVSIFYSNPILKKLLAVVWLNLVLELTAILAGALLSLTFEISYVYNKDSEINNYIYTPVCHFIMIIVIIILKRFMRKNNYLANLWIYFCQLIIPVLSCIFIEVIIVRAYYTNSIDVVIVGLNICTFLIINIVVYYVFYLYERLNQKQHDEKLELEMHKEREAYYKKLESHQERIRIMKHDFKNQLLLISSYISEVKIKKDIADMIDVIDDYDKNLIFTKNTVVNTVLSQKYCHAQGLGISFTYDIYLPEQIDIEQKDIISLFGNILDNAIEAAEYSEKNKYIKLKILYYKASLSIHVENSFDGKMTNLDTKKEDKLSHGLGVKSIVNMVEKYNGKFDWKAKDGVFTVDIIIWEPQNKLGG